MKTAIMPSRRQFVKYGLGGATALGIGSRHAGAAPVEPAPARRRKSKIRIGCRINEAWLKSERDDDLRFLKQIGVDWVDIEFAIVKGYRQTGCFTRSAWNDLVRRFDAVGLKIERANSLAPQYVNAHLNRPEGQKEIDNLKRIGEMMAATDIPVFGIQACQASQFVRDNRRGWDRRQGRGGYGYPSFDTARAKNLPAPPSVRYTAGDLWKGIINIYRQVLPTVAGSKTRIAMHGNDPPLYEYLGNPQILCRFADFDRLFREAPSRHSGITFCVGTRYESGENVLDGIRHFGKQGKLFHVHFRNVRGTLPRGGYSEVMVDDGDMDMARVLRALHDVDYDGVIDYDHPMTITGDQPLPKQYIAFAVGYMRGLIDGLPG